MRDLLLERETLVDLDFAIPGDGLAAARRVAQVLDAAFYPLDPERGVGRVVYQAANLPAGREARKYHLDFARFRGSTLQEDLADRDFTINAMALSIDEVPRLIDPLQGQRDLELGQVRATSPDTFQNDPVRVLRAIRQATEFEFSIEAKTEQYLREAAPALVGVSPERQRDELIKLLCTPRPGQALRALQKLDVLHHLLPELAPMIGVSQSPPHHLDVFEHTATALDAWAAMGQAGWPDLPDSFRPEAIQTLQEILAGDLTQAALMPLALLLHDSGKPLTRSISQENGETRVRFLGHEQESARIARRTLRRFRFSSQASEFVETVVAHHMRPILLASAGSISRRAIYRFFRDTAGNGYQAGVAVALHALADQRATYLPDQRQIAEQALLDVIGKLLKAYFGNRSDVVNPPQLLSGYDIMEKFHLSEGRLIGRLLSRLKEAQAMGLVYSQADALTFIEAELGRVEELPEDSSED